MVAFLEGAAVVVIGSTGGIGAALVQGLEGAGAHVTCYSRRASDPAFRLDLLDEESISRAAQSCPASPRLIVVATGVLHGPGMSPEKTYQGLDPQTLMRAWQINAIGPALIAKHFLPLLPRQGRAMFAALSARVASIGDNRAGGWHSYRASKAGLNMLLRNLAIELARTRPEQIVLGLHPGTVETGLSAPFRRSVSPSQLFTAAQSAAYLLQVIQTATVAQSGCVLAWDGTTIPP